MLSRANTTVSKHVFNSILLVPVDFCGPGDNFDPESSEVISALIRKCVETKARSGEEIVVCGVGSPTREFIYVYNAADGLIKATQCFKKSISNKKGVESC